jgi:hypothetical protein
MGQQDTGQEICLCCVLCLDRFASLSHWLVLPGLVALKSIASSGSPPLTSVTDCLSTDLISLHRIVTSVLSHCVCGY